MFGDYEILIPNYDTDTVGGYRLPPSMCEQEKQIFREKSLAMHQMPGYSNSVILDDFPYHERMNTMTTLELILTIIQLISGLAVTVIVLMQSGKTPACPRHCRRCKRSFPKAKPRRSMPLAKGDEVVGSSLSF